MKIVSLSFFCWTQRKISNQAVNWTHWLFKSINGLVTDIIQNVVLMFSRRKIIIQVWNILRAS